MCGLRPESLTRMMTKLIVLCEALTLTIVLLPATGIVHCRQMNQSSMALMQHMTADTFWTVWQMGSCALYGLQAFAAFHQGPSKKSSGNSPLSTSEHLQEQAKPDASSQAAGMYLRPSIQLHVQTHLLKAQCVLFGGFRLLDLAAQ